MNQISLENVDLKFISVDDMIYIEKLLNQKISDVSFAKKLVFHQLLYPKLYYKQYKSITTDLLKELVNLLLQKEKEIFKYYKNTGSVFKDFKQAIIMEKKNNTEQFKIGIKPLINQIQSSINSFNSEYSKFSKQSLGSLSPIQASLLNLSTLAQELSKSQKPINISIKPIIEQYRTLAQVLDVSLRPQINIWEAWINQNHHIYESFDNFWEEFRKTSNITQTRAVKILQKYKWFITPGMSLKFLMTVVKLDEKKDRQDKAINRLFIDYFRADKWKNLEEMVSTWKNNPLFIKRNKIIKDCTYVIKNYPFREANITNVVLPTLITQIDGVISDYLILKGLSWDSDFDDWIDKKTGKVSKVGRKSQLIKIKPKILPTSLDDLANDIFLNILFQKSQKGKPLTTPFNFNRHKIIHGEISRYGRLVYLVRAFMVLDLLAHF